MDGLLQLLKSLDGFEDCSIERYQSLTTDEERLSFVNELRDEILAAISSNEDDIRDIEAENDALERQKEALEPFKRQLRLKLGIDPCPGQLLLRLPS